MKKAIMSIVVAVIVIGGGWYLYMQNQAKAPSETIQSNDVTPAPSPTPVTAPNTQAQTNNSTSTKDYTPPGAGGETTAPNIQVTEVDYDGTSFSPSTVTIKKGDYVIFKNKGTTGFWPASNPHPVHTDYPGFDALQSIDPGGTYKFQFNNVGTWGYHDHLNPRHGGTVVVTQ